MQGKNGELNGGQELTRIQQEDFNYGNLFQRIIDSVNSLAYNLGATASGKSTPPTPIDAIQVQGTQTVANNTLIAPSEILHWTLTHNQPVQKGVRYFSEIDTDPNFPQPHVHDHGTSRSGFLTLPTLDNNGNTQTYYLRSYPQHPGSDPAQPKVFGGLAGATKIQMTGSSKTTLLSSTGSGTASSTGTQGGKGLGVLITRPAPGPKRSLSQ